MSVPGTASHTPPSLILISLNYLFHWQATLPTFPPRSVLCCQKGTVTVSISQEHVRILRMWYYVWLRVFLMGLCFLRISPLGPGPLYCIPYNMSTGPTVKVLGLYWYPDYVHSCIFLYMSFPCLFLVHMYDLTLVHVLCTNIYFGYYYFGSL